MQKVLSMGLMLCLTTIALADNKADLIVHNAKVTTLDQDNPKAEAVAVKDGEFVYVGDNQGALAYQSDKTVVIDAQGRRMIPGLIDSHLHPTRGARFFNAELRWDRVESLEEGLAMLKGQAARTPKGQWVRVIGGWSPFQFSEKRMPTVEEINEAAPDTPVFILYLYSKGFLNKAGLKALGITKETKAPWGSRYVVDDKGEPTGELIADPNPMILYQTIASLPGLTSKEQYNSAQYFYHTLSALGLTSVIDAGGGGHHFPEDYSATDKLAKEDKLPLRVSYYLFPQKPNHELEDFKKWIKTNTVSQNNHQTLQHGYTLEGGGEFLVWSAGDYENFRSERPNLKEASDQQLTEVVTLLVKNKWPFRIHATYDESIDRILTVFEKVNKQYPFKDIRWLIDHAETISLKNINRVKALGGGIAIQNRMAYAGEDFVERYGIQKAANAPPTRQLIDSGIPIGAGTDGTRVSSYNPWHSLYWLTTGKTMGGLKIANNENVLSREEALKLFTIGSAWVSGEEHLKGKIQKGQYADFALLSGDYLTIPDEDIKDIMSVLTVVGGKIRYGAFDYENYAPTLPPVKPNWSPVRFYPGHL